MKYRRFVLTAVFASASMGISVIACSGADTTLAPPEDSGTAQTDSGGGGNGDQDSSTSQSQHDAGNVQDSSGPKNRDGSLPEAGPATSCAVGPQGTEQKCIRCCETAYPGHLFIYNWAFFEDGGTSCTCAPY